MNNESKTRKTIFFQRISHSKWIEIIKRVEGTFYCRGSDHKPVDMEKLKGWLNEHNFILGDLKEVQVEEHYRFFAELRELFIFECEDKST